MSKLISYIDNMERLIKELKEVDNKESQEQYLKDIVEFTEEEIERL